eukprot:GEMP01020554.1.p1 GENE.GEMP01020554.1~~GEMP01020554.1.p1  ORF type:complete len:289 (+),score=70.89 GEMP01020554.1:491-1357(+)
MRQEAKQVAALRRTMSAPDEPYMQYCSVKIPTVWVTDMFRQFVPMDETDADVLIDGSPVCKLQKKALDLLVETLRREHQPVVVLLGNNSHLIETYLCEVAHIPAGQIRLDIPTRTEPLVSSSEENTSDDEGEGGSSSSKEGDDEDDDRWHGPKVEAYFPREIKVADGKWNDYIVFPPEDARFERTSVAIGIMASVIKLQANNISIVEGHADEGIHCGMLLDDLSMARALDVASFLGKVTTIGRAALRKMTHTFGDSSVNRRVCFFLEEKPVMKPPTGHFRCLQRKQSF